jgi:Icc-related predicted phosphoesterase
MKNIHVLPTSQPSNLVFEKLSNRFYTNSRRKSNTNNLQNQNVYITSDEEIKEDDWVIYNNKVFKIGRGDNELFHLSKKTILTTDQDLIKDGIQAIDDEFLEWFVKNPSCAYVTVCDVVFGEDRTCKKYIVIPKEESKQENCCTPAGQIRRYVDCKGCDRKPEQETLEEAAENNSKKAKSIDGIGGRYLGFVDGVKWQAERMYSEEDVLDIFHEWFCYQIDEDVEIKLSFQKWFEQFKKKL